ncbi:hypothetical protein DUNSADRAFT_6179 [Dunaliella salina]|uniref:Encoded protein n=1 Tax=Dunaliella salina TaxID=3046 RepID=A0ABQ7FTY1_DUNSA|nr:hypothetical protein DUNSADRAFT_6179 [Dunaliella salina]|eukprot:KAF5825885.1 hypothetical protein DUNSADRAFT_6179 [Dunaliella salina]
MLHAPEAMAIKAMKLHFLQICSTTVVQSCCISPALACPRAIIFAMLGNGPLCLRRALLCNPFVETSFSARSLQQLSISRDFKTVLGEKRLCHALF